MLSQSGSAAQVGKRGLAPDARGDMQYAYRFDVAEFRDLRVSELVVERITGAGFPLPYRSKLSPLSKIVERINVAIDVAGAPSPYVGRAPRCSYGHASALPCPT